MTGPNMGQAQVDVTELLALLATAERAVLESAEGSAEYRAGQADAYTAAQDTLRELAGWPVEAASSRT
ncbi:hypothetical protein [Amycolatopsis sp. cmx-4-54]|uniref:hypothetical protein n=1 Tax=Amycolatopsis sp. cmx-4-54 TaxID=2790936 RepID=UPI00397E0F2B